ncbi:hypothetical protein [Candidatus Marithrix sp. Canyon 246]|uniref:hypothetical protein n=1 Tax=Candidatus Marithrix sp. Canyon 246 TaxID=1827136 RepID=UPI00084A0A43|nr:hypothetical protein [Candidatus Marithrix sp. Canyon 246]
MSRLIILLLLTFATVNVTQAANMVVINSNDTNLFSKGKLLNTDISHNIPAKVKITVVFESGSVKTVIGPYSQPLKDPLAVNDPKLVITLANFLKNKSIFRSRGEDPSYPWLVDVNTTKRFYCIAPASNVILSRPQSDSQSASTLLIKHTRTDKVVIVRWPAHKTSLNWPSSLPVRYGDTYKIEVKTRSNSSIKKLVLHQLPNGLPTNSHKVVWMVGRGCIREASQLLSRLW